MLWERRPPPRTGEDLVWDVLNVAPLMTLKTIPWNRNTPAYARRERAVLVRGLLLEAQACFSGAGGQGHSHSAPGTAPASCVQRRAVLPAVTQPASPTGDACSQCSLTLRTVWSLSVCQARSVPRLTPQTPRSCNYWLDVCHGENWSRRLSRYWLY